jgi:hypothetical protein
MSWHRLGAYMYYYCSGMFSNKYFQTGILGVSVSKPTGFFRIALPNPYEKILLPVLQLRMK